MNTNAYRPRTRWFQGHLLCRRGAAGTTTTTTTTTTLIPTTNKNNKFTETKKQSPYTGARANNTLP